MKSSVQPEFRIPHSAIGIGPIDELDRRIILATQAGLPLVARPYHALADELGVSADEVMQRMQRMLDMSEAERRAAAEAGRRRAAAFTWAHTAELTLAANRQFEAALKRVRQKV